MANDQQKEIVENNDQEVVMENNEQEVFAENNDQKAPAEKDDKEALKKKKITQNKVKPKTQSSEFQNEIRELLKQHKKDVLVLKKDIGQLSKIDTGNKNEISILKDTLLIGVESLELLTKKMEIQLRKS